ncbi:hypothetical protein XENTR_v10001651 [Xenopus tropicalis]|nr:hypothetical protein XENTR_v10001651 [Xenopus tropicalis]
MSSKSENIGIRYVFSDSPRKLASCETCSLQSCVWQLNIYRGNLTTQIKVLLRSFSRFYNLLQTRLIRTYSSFEFCRMD